jgi:chromate reductase
VTEPGTPISILAIPGSLRRHSYNRGLLRAAAELGAPTAVIDIFDALETVPVFNEDLEGAPDDPPGVVRLRSALVAADGLLIATPEYNQSVPGVVKNTIDWLSRGAPDQTLARLPVAITGATTGPWGTRLAQTQLRQMLASVGALVMPAPMLFIAGVDSLFEQGQLTDPETRSRLGELVASFAEWTRLVGERRRQSLQLNV